MLLNAPITNEIDRLGQYPHLLEIARCESNLTHFNPDGTVLRGRVNPHDIGILQINSDYHQKEAEKLGFDIYTLKGNIDYGIALYEAQGEQPWFWSGSCHKK